MAMRFRRKKNMSVMKIGIKVGITVVTLYAAGLLLNIMGEIMNGTASAFYEGVRLIGWTVTDGATGTATACHAGASDQVDNCITDTSGSGILAIIGLLALIWIVFEFVNVSY